MSNVSKKRQELLKQIAGRGQVADISFLEKIKDVIFNPKRFDILPKTAIIQGTEEPKRFTISFEFCDEDQCQLDQIDATKARAIIRFLNRVSKCNVNSLASSGLIRDTVPNEGEYASLFLKLTPDVKNLCEGTLPDGARIFFFTEGETFQVVAIETKHRNND